MRSEFTGMLPGAIEKFEALYDALDSAGLNPRITGGYSGHGDESDLRTWGVVCDMQCADRARLETEAAILGIVIQPDGSLAYMNGLTVADFQTYRVGPDLAFSTAETEV